MNTLGKTLTPAVLNIDEAAEVARISLFIREVLSKRLKRRGLVIAMSGGIDSSVCAALSVEAVGKKKVFGLIMPELDSAQANQERGEILATHLGIEYEIIDITRILTELGCYSQRDAAIKRLFPDYAADWKSKIVLSGGLEGRLNHFQLIVEPPNAGQMCARLQLTEYLQIVAATNFKQRTRKTLEYFHADRLNYAVVGTPNRLEFDQGFFVKNGDGSADIKPIAHLYKTQVYSLARFLELPEEICGAQPTTDTYSLPQGQDEFYFALPYSQMDLALWAYDHGVAAEELADCFGVDPQRAEWIYKDIERKRAVSIYLHASPVGLDG